MSGASKERELHAFEKRPHRTLLTLSLPVMLSLVVQPLAGVVDTAFVERLGAASAAALGAATAVLAGFLWVFNFLGIGTQTEVARSIGQDRAETVCAATSLALLVSLSLGTAAAFAFQRGTISWCIRAQVILSMQTSIDLPDSHRVAQCSTKSAAILSSRLSAVMTS